MPKDWITTSTLLHQLRDFDDDAAWRRLVERFRRPIVAFAIELGVSPADAEDVAQETFISLYRHGKRFRSEARFSTFVYRVAANAALNRRRTLGRKRAREEALARHQDAGFDLPVTPRDPESAASGSQIQVRVQLSRSCPEAFSKDAIRSRNVALPHANSIRKSCTPRRNSSRPRRASSSRRIAGALL